MDKRLFDDDSIIQISFVTDDLDKSVAWFTDLSGIAPSHIGTAAGYAEAKATYHGAPADLSCRLAVYRLSNVDIEFLEPGPERSVWRDVLEAKGPCVHHIAFKTRNLPKHSAYMKSKGYNVMQTAEFFGSHGRYAYFDLMREMGLHLELLEYNNDMAPR